MEQLLHVFGIDAKLIIVQIINFVALATILSYLLYKPVLRLLNEREEKIKQGVRDAEAAAVSKAEADEKKTEIVSAAEAEAASVNEKARVQAGEYLEEKKSEASTRAAEIVAEAESKAEEMKKTAMRDSEAEVAKAAVLAAEKILREKKA